MNAHNPIYLRMISKMLAIYCFKSMMIVSGGYYVVFGFEDLMDKIKTIIEA
jgi:hypothetical protein